MEKIQVSITRAYGGKAKPLHPFRHTKIFALKTNIPKLIDEAIETKKQHPHSNRADSWKSSNTWNPFIKNIKSISLTTLEDLKSQIARSAYIYISTKEY